MNFGKALKSIAGPLLGVASTLIPGGPAISGVIPYSDQGLGVWDPEK